MKSATTESIRLAIFISSLLLLNFTCMTVDVKAENKSDRSASTQEENQVNNPKPAEVSEAVPKADNVTTAKKEIKPFVVALYDDNCRYSCRLVRPMMKDLSKQFADKVEFHELNLTKRDPSRSLKKAKALGVESFVITSAPYIPCVGIFSGNKVLVKEIPAKKPRAVYVRYIEKAINQS